jgi:tRNA pseudouridine55 synthase
MQKLLLPLVSFPMHGLLVIDKPPRLTSRDVVNRVLTWFPRKTKIGHTGTLDPLATGVLVLCVGAATKLVETVQNMGKTYVSIIRFGATSDTDDADGTITPNLQAPKFPRAALEELLPKFLGEIQQLPPTYSALKIDGRRAHDLARRGQEVQLAPRPVRVDSFKLLQYEWPFAEVEIACGKGTYIRSIARDVGALLGVGGLVQELRRTKVGPFHAEHAIGIEEKPADLQAALQQGRQLMGTIEPA